MKRNEIVGGNKDRQGFLHTGLMKAQHLKTLAVFGLTSLMLKATPVYAGDSFDDAADVQGSDVMSKILTVVGTLCTYVGVILLIGAVVALIMAFKNEELEGKHRAGLGIAVAIGLLCMKGILTAVTGIG